MGSCHRTLACWALTLELGLACAQCAAFGHVPGARVMAVTSLRCGHGGASVHQDQQLCYLALDLPIPAKLGVAGDLWGTCPRGALGAVEPCPSVPASSQPAR